MPQTTPKLLASRQEAAEALNVSVRTIDALAKRGMLLPVFIGSRKLFAWADLMRLARARYSQHRSRGERAEAPKIPDKRRDE